MYSTTIPSYLAWPGIFFKRYFRERCRIKSCKTRSNRYRVKPGM